MRLTRDWKSYELIDASEGERLERWGDVLLARPDPQVIWHTPKSDYRWGGISARYHRSHSGGGEWEFFSKIKDFWKIPYKNLNFGIKLMNFKHTGIFPEQAVNWNFLQETIKNNTVEEPLNVLNLFAYTGGATLACAEAGAKICHVDASKGMVFWAKENAKLSNLEKAPIRWIVDDCEKFVLREIRREIGYDGIIMDPPSYGRGPKGETWKLEDNLFEFVKLCEKLLSKNAKFFILNSYSTGLSAGVMTYVLEKTIKEIHGGKVSSTEIGIPVTSSGLILPAGSTAIWQSE